MLLEQLGAPIKFGEYMNRYEEMIRHVLSELSFVDFESDKIKALIRAEMRKAETSFFVFYDQNKREPDYAFLQRKITEFGVDRLEYFLNEETILSVDNFVHRYIEMLKIEKLLTGLVFDTQDLLFIEKYERNHAERHFEKHNEYLPGYEQERISVNETVQQLAYKKLKKEFLDDSFIDSFRRKRKR